VKYVYYIVDMNTILSVCSEYSDNVWYSGFGVDAVPSKIAIEIEKEYKFAFIKSMVNHGYTLSSLRRLDEQHCVITLNKRTAQEKLAV
jgi:hypothetical protein